MMRKSNWRRQRSGFGGIVEVSYDGEICCKHFIWSADGMPANAMHANAMPNEAMPGDVKNDDMQHGLASSGIHKKSVRRN
jgi:hypothetical protein